MPEIIPNYHPIMVHFTIALVITSFGTLLLSYIFQQAQSMKQELLIVSRWCLWLAALASILTIIAGLHAFYTVEHNAVSHPVMIVHRYWGIGTFIAIWLMAIWSYVLYRKQKLLPWFFIVALAITTILVMITGWYGAELVFRYGTGVRSLPQTTAIQCKCQSSTDSRLLKTPKATDNHGNHAH